MSRRAIAGVTLVAAFAVPSAARADGGTSIASATPVTFGQQEFGNLATGGQGAPGCFSSDGATWRSWWAVPVTAGDRLTVDWESQNLTAVMNLWSVGTTDFTFPDKTPSATAQPNDNHKTELRYTAASTGTMPLEFFYDTGCVSDGDPGPYDFTASVKHAVRLALPRVSRLARNGTLRVSVRNPDGLRVTAPALRVVLQAHRAGGPWKTVGRSGVTNGVARVHFRLSVKQRSRIALRALARGTGYVSASSATAKVTVR